MKLYTAQASWNGYRVISVPVDIILYAMPEPDYPANHRALLMAELWAQVRGFDHRGILWLAPDVALDPEDIEAMGQAVEQLPRDVHTGLVKLWPASTGRSGWMWSHRSGTIGNPAATQDETAPVTYFSIDCVWTPARLLNAAMPLLPRCYFTEIDLMLSEQARQLGIEAHIVPGCRPKHLHF